MKTDGRIQADEVTGTDEQGTDRPGSKTYIYMYLHKSSPFLSVIHIRSVWTQV